MTSWEQSNRDFQRDRGGVKRWRDQTPRVLQDAIQDCWDGTGTEAQKRLLRNWVTARVCDTSLPAVELLTAHLSASRLRRNSSEPSTSTRSASRATGTGTERTQPDSSR